MLPPSPRSLLEALADGRSAIGPFRRLDGHERVRVVRDVEREGMRAVVFVHDLTPASDTAENTATTIACFSAADLDVTGFVLEPATPPLDPISRVLGYLAVAALWVFRPLMASSPAYPAVEIPGRPLFSARYSLRSPSPRRIREIFAPAVLDFFEANPGWSVEGITGRVLVFRADVLEAPSRVDAFLGEAATVAARFRTAPRASVTAG
jgi:hypothetical protein